LLKIEKFKFALAHISWPWTDECIALFGQWKHAKSKGTISSEMFIDITPGTPPLYREDALKKLLSFGAEDNILFGTDNTITSRWTDKMSEINLYGPIEKDIKLYKKIAMSNSTIRKITYSNYEKFFS